MIHEGLAHLAVSVDAVTQHPKNPRKGSVTHIAESLRVNGQYRPIVANRRDGHILAGNHTWAAARELGWSEVAVAWVDVDDETALKILLADNRLADLADYNSVGLLELLQALPTLEGTAYDTAFMENLAMELDDPMPLLPDDREGNEPLAPGGEDERPPVDTVAFFKTPALTVTLDEKTTVEWAAQYRGHAGRDEVLRLLGWPLGRPRVTRALSQPGAVRRIGATKAVPVDALRIPVADLRPHPLNPRQGDVGGIAESLAANGQYRPIVVNRRDNTVLAGNHTLYAAKALGWEEVAATYVDVDDEAALRILLADNRTADMGEYELDALLSALDDLSTLEGSGFSYEDLDDLRTRRPGPDVRPARSAELVIVCEKAHFRLTAKADWDEYDFWWSHTQAEAARLEVSAQQMLMDVLGLQAGAEGPTVQTIVAPGAVQCRIGTHADVAPWEKTAAKEHVSATDTSDTEWVVAEVGGELIGFTGVYRYGKGHKYARIKGVWLRPEYRGQGFGEVMTDYAIDVAADHPTVERLDVIAIDPKFYRQRGWQEQSVRPNGGTVLHRDVVREPQ